MTYEGRYVHTPEDVNFDTMQIGDLVNAEVGEYIINVLPPATMRWNCLQLGEAHSFKIDEEGKARSTYLTLRKLTNDILEFCGYCFRGENVERGREIPYV